ncbi:Pre-mRNA splicing factor-domain-containing protein [Choanephora cucurbitarum]|nr:Pre-mRNA splicing factor-domain-containing protein [Choanephora cucurbitarum]
MGSSDLNLKKSWHPATFKNQERVWKEEQKRKEEDRKLDQLKKELAEERQLQDLQRMQEEAGTKKRSNKLDWMYASPNANLNGSANNTMEDYLLGKKNVDDLLRAKQKEQVQAATAAEENRFTLSNANANSERDIQSKIREDPLLMIKKREQMALKAIVENPLKLKELKKKEKKKKKSSEHKHHHHSSSRSRHEERGSYRDDHSQRRHDSRESSSRHRHDSRERSSRHRHRDEDESRRKRSRRRSASPY